MVGARRCICCWISLPTEVHQQRSLELKQKLFLFSEVSFKVGIKKRSNCWVWFSLMGRVLLLTYEPELFYYLCKSMDAYESHNVNKLSDFTLAPAVYCINTPYCFRPRTPEKSSYRGFPSCNVFCLPILNLLFLLYLNSEIGSRMASQQCYVKQ